jgi:Transposase DDE domain
MRHPYVITPAVVHRHACQALRRSLDWKPFHDSVSVDHLLDLLLLMAASTASLFATVRRFFSFSHQTASLAVKANLPDRQDAKRLTHGLVAALFEVANFSRQDRRRHWMAAIDVHNVPYYGQHTPYVVGGPKKQGTKWFFSYATVVLLHKRRRYTIAVEMVLPQTKPHEIVRALLDQIAAKGLKIRGVTLDSAFDSGDTLLLLQERKLAYSIPLRRKGTGKNARNQCFEGRHQTVRWTEWTTEVTRRRVRTRIFLWKGRPKTMVFAFQGWKGDRARNVHQQATASRRLYRRRFGIETSYRQKNQAQACTTSRDPIYRLLLEGIGYLLRQVWVVLTEVLARLTRAPSSAWIGALTLQKMIDWLVHELTTLHPESHEITAKTARIQTGSS